nr:MAG TPA: hypothetical protein [Caudoviricetes sp.]
MYVTWTAYVLLQAWCRLAIGAFLPPEVTYGTAALFIVETVSLARLKMAKEGSALPKKTPNAFLSKIGIGDVPDFEEEAQIESAKHAQKEESK